MEKNEKDNLILIIDDQPNNLKVISSVLGKDYKLSLANSGFKALEILDNIKPDLILLDVMMPEMNGFEFINKIKENPDLKDIPVIFLTAKTDIEDIVKGFDMGAVDYISKPFNVKETLVRIKNQIVLQRALKDNLEKKEQLEVLNNDLNDTIEELNKRNEDLTLAHEAIENHAHETNQMLHKLLISENQLIQSNQQLKKASMEREKIFSIISHDLKSPFSGLLGLSKMLSEDYKNMEESEVEEIIKSLYGATDNLYKLVINLLDWSRIHRGSINLNKKNIRLRSFVESIVSEYNLVLKSKKLKINLNINKHINIFADMNTLSIVLRNVINNAIKFSFENSNIDISCEEDNSDYIKLSIKDYGIGMSEALKEHLFDLSKSVTRLGTNNEKGTGLGLILCKEFLELNGGSLSFDSVINEGSIFILQIPTSGI